MGKDQMIEATMIPWPAKAPLSVLGGDRCFLIGAETSLLFGYHGTFFLTPSRALSHG